ncbi:MAG: hypothetical protein HQ513_03870 [Rhodospirillales bacterium]|nr:hypothetical protein [Rhodospirillales bacterium]
MYNDRMEKMSFIPSAFLLLVMLTACASPPAEIPAAYVPMKTYAALACEQIQAELESNAEETSLLQFSLQDKANIDAAQMGIGFIFFPTLLFLEGGDGKDARQYAQLKGERRALAGQVAKKSCPIDLNDTDLTLASEACRNNTNAGQEECPPAIVRRIPLLQ